MKQNKIIKLLSLLLAVVMMGAFLTACDNGNTSDGSETDENFSSGADDLLTLIENGSAKCTIVYPMRGSKKASSTAYALASTLKSLYGADVTIKDDYVTEDSDVSDDVEILIGEVDRAEVEAVSAKLSYSTDWAVCVSGNKLIIVAMEDDGYDRAMEYFQTTYLAEGGTTLAVSRTLSQYRLLAANTMLQNATLYTVVYAADATARVKEAAITLKNALEQYSDGKKVAITSDSTAETQYEILVGDTNRKESKTGVKFFYYDYLIRTEGDKIAINAGGSFAVQNAVDKLMELLIHEELEDQYYEKFDTSLFNTLAYDQSSFIPVWKDSITVPDWMKDFNEKLYAITNPSGRPMCVAHRGDVINYPEDSLEGFLSAALLGTDVIEMDLQLTKDHVLVLCHDDTLTKTTNVSKMKGKNGLPDSVYVTDWTYAELQQLSLLDTDGNVTQYKLPSYYEILLTMRGRCFLAIDQKVVGSFTYEDVFEIETETDSVEVSIYSVFLSASSGPAQANSYQYVINYSKAHPEMTRLAAYAEKLESYMKLSGHTIRNRGWITGKATTDPSLESHEDYLTVYENGLRLIYTNNIPLMSTFIAKYQPDLK